MSPNILLYFRLLRDVSDGLELLYDLSKECNCPHIDSLQDALVSLGEFTDNVRKDIFSDKSDSDLPF